MAHFGGVLVVVNAALQRPLGFMEPAYVLEAVAARHTPPNNVLDW